MRAAIQTLCHEGLLKRERNRSAFVPLLTRDEVRDLFSVRIPIECLIVRELLTRNASLDGVHAAIGPLAALRVDSRWSQVVDADMGFHQALAHAAGSPRLERLYASMSGEIRLCIAQLRPSWASPAAMGEEHRDLLAVIERGDVAEAEARMTAHLDRALHDLTGKLTSRLFDRPAARGSPCHAASRMRSSASTSSSAAGCCRSAA